MLQRSRLTALVAVACTGLTSCFPGDFTAGCAYVGPARTSTAEPSAAAVTPPTVPETGPIALTVTGAILMAIENNREFAVTRFNPTIARASEETARAAFDPTLRLEASRQRTVSDSSAPSGRAVTDGDTVDASLATFLPTGTSIALGATQTLTDSSLYADESRSVRAGLTVTQALLNGGGLGVNLASLRQARLASRDAEHAVRGLAEALVANVEKTCWDYALATRQIAIYTESLKLAERQLEETREQIRVGRFAEVELAAAQAEAASRRENLINTRSALAQTRLILARLLGLSGNDAWNREIVISTLPAIPEVTMDDVTRHVAMAARLRPDLNQARLAVRRGELEIVKTRNGLLPRLDFFITLGSTGYARSFGDSLQEVDGDSYDTLLGLRLDVPLGNREARARHLQALAGLDQAKAALQNMGDLVEADVRSAYIEVGRAKEQIAATAASRKLREEVLRTEAEKFRVGKSTSILVAQAQRDLVTSQNSEVAAVITYLKALIDLYRLEGSLLDRRGIEAPGRGSVEALTR